MSAPQKVTSEAVAKVIDTIEATYDLMLAYAAQGRQREEDDPVGVRKSLRDSIAAIDALMAATPESVNAPGGEAISAAAAMLDVMREDARKTRAAFAFVLAQRSISSQTIDNLNASIHVRALLTSLFIIDETLNLSNLG
ncbi:MAG: hypothetical protein FJX29_01160 [Alphaproteobacteria bacterium]|nr:hypothetical protein [Alphaproteobacteria bacterium]